MWHLRSGRKTTGGRLRKNTKKKKRHRGSKFLETLVSERKAKIVDTRSSKKKIKLLSENTANVADSTGKVKKVKILSVKESRTTPHYVRRNILTKGEVIETEAGLARVTSRPGQAGVVNAVLREGTKLFFYSRKTSRYIMNIPSIKKTSW
jgi:small subunit ribosomal protein S8e